MVIPVDTTNFSVGPKDRDLSEVWFAIKLGECGLDLRLGEGDLLEARFVTRPGDCGLDLGLGEGDLSEA